MSSEEIQMLPSAFIRKFGSFLTKIEDNLGQAHLDENRQIDN